jgi:cystathionine beta-lyase
MAHPYDRLSPARLRRPSSQKWTAHGDDVLPLWVADMDFPPAEPIREAVARFVRDEHFMYAVRRGIPDLYESVHDHLSSRYGWSAPLEAMQMVSGLVPAVFASVRTLVDAGERVLLPTPAYFPFMEGIRNTGRVDTLVPMRNGEGGYALDLAAMAESITPDTRTLIHCNPHNPTGRVSTQAEQERLAEFVLEHDLTVISDEVHADLMYEGEHLPFASLGPEIAERTITLWAASKAYNIAGLNIGFAIITNPALLARFNALMRGASPTPNAIGQVATVAALRHGDAWLADTVAYLGANRHRVVDLVERYLPAARYRPPQATYFAWLDLNAYDVGEAPAATLIERAGVALNCGSITGPGGEGHARLNFATSPSILDEAFQRMANALATPDGG